MTCQSAVVVESVCFPHASRGLRFLFFVASFGGAALSNFATICLLLSQNSIIFEQVSTHKITNYSFTNINQSELLRSSKKNTAYVIITKIKLLFHFFFVHAFPYAPEMFTFHSKKCFTSNYNDTEVILVNSACSGAPTDHPLCVSQISIISRYLLT